MNIIGYAFLSHTIKCIGFFSIVSSDNSCIDVYSYSCLHKLSNERKSMFKSGDSRAVLTWVWT